MDSNNQNLPNNNVQSPGNFDASQFDFIMNPNTPPKKSLLPSFFNNKIIAFAGIGIVVIFLVVIIFSIIGSSPSSFDGYYAILKKQTEITRIAEIGKKNARSSEAQKLATMTFTTITTDKKAVIEYLTTNKQKINDKEILLAQNKNLDTELNNAITNGRFDEEFLAIMDKLLADYSQLLQQNYESSGKKGKEILQTSYHNIELINP